MKKAASSARDVVLKREIILCKELFERRDVLRDETMPVETFLSYVCGGAI
jgi:hypothetical protein